MDPDRLLVLGDTHGSTTAVHLALAQAAEWGCQVVLQLGDFGWWPHARRGAEFIEKVDDAAARAGVRLVFVGGNHENWEDLDLQQREAPRDEDGFVVVGAATRYLPRPHRWSWHGLTFGALGGAWSIDHRRRSPFISWWPQEQPTLGHAEELVSGGRLDVLVAHDAPFAVDFSQTCFTGDDLDGDVSTRRLVQHVVDECRPDLVLHGHWHHRHTTTLPSGTVVEGFAHEQLAPELRHAVVELSPDAARVAGNQGAALPVRD